MVTPALANAAWWAAGAPAWIAFEAALRNPGAAQERILRHLLKRNAGTAYGREHGFADIRHADDFARRIPPRDYDELRPWIERVRRGEPNVLTAEPVRRLVPTSGSTAARKLIPHTTSLRDELNRAIGPWIFDLFRRHPGAARGPAYWSVTPVAESGDGEGAEAGSPPIGFDDDADYLGGWRKDAVAAVMAVPSIVRKVRSIEVWRYVTLLALLRRRDLALVSVWHPSFLELLLEAMRDDWLRLIADVAGGTCAVEAAIPAEIATVARSKPLRARASELSRLTPGAIHRIWPRLRVVSCWADANAAAPAAALARTMRGVALQPKGLLATEGVVSIPYAGFHPLAVRSHYYEFEDDAGRIHGAAELRRGPTYTVLLTTGGGLYRYRLLDVVEVDGWAGRTPSIRFIGKDGLISDRAGEKLSDRFVAEVLAKLFADTDVRPRFALLAPESAEGAVRYTLYVDAPTPASTSGALDVLLSSNPQYAYCRRLGQLKPPAVQLVGGGAYAVYTDRLRRNGQRLGDIKPAALSPLDGWSSLFSVCTPNDRTRQNRSAPI